MALNFKKIITKAPRDENTKKKNKNTILFFNFRHFSVI
jgi:hypothetical protein